jgi:hypothetical protein
MSGLEQRGTDQQGEAGADQRPAQENRQISRAEECKED